MLIIIRHGTANALSAAASCLQPKQLALVLRVLKTFEKMSLVNLPLRFISTFHSSVKKKTLTYITLTFSVLPRLQL